MLDNFHTEDGFLKKIHKSLLSFLLSVAWKVVRHLLSKLEYDELVSDDALQSLDSISERRAKVCLKKKKNRSKEK